MQQFKHWYTAQDDPAWEDIHKLHKYPGFYTASTVPDCIGYGYSSAGKQFDYRNNLCKYPAPSPIVLQGKNNEPIAMNELGLTFPDAYFVRPGLLKHPTLPHIGASLDTVRIDPNGDLYPVEIKVQFGNFADSIDDIKPQWLVQIMIQMDCLGVERAGLFMWSPDKKRYFEITKDPAFMETIYRKLDNFRKSFTEGKRIDRMVRDKELDMYFELFRNHNIKKVDLCP